MLPRSLRKRQMFAVVRASRTPPRPPATSGRPECRPPRWPPPPPLAAKPTSSSSHRSSCAAASASGSAAPSPPAGPPAPPSRTTPPPPGAARPRPAASPPPDPPRAAREAEEWGGACRGFWVATNRRIWAKLGSFGSAVSPSCCPDEGSRFRCLAGNRFPPPDRSWIYSDKEEFQTSSVEMFLWVLTGRSSWIDENLSGEESRRL